MKLLSNNLSNSPGTSRAADNGQRGVCAVTLVSRDPNVIQTVNATTREAKTLAPAVECADFDELLVELHRHNHPVVLVDIDEDPQATLDELAQIIDQYPAARFVVLTSVEERDVILDAMRAGARHLMKKEDIPSQLLPVLKRILPQGSLARTDAGAVITVLSAGGGCGATTLAVNLAYEMHERRDSPTLLIDLDLCHGGAAGYLGIDADFGVANVLSDESRIDAQLIKSTAVPHDDALHLLASPSTVEFDHAEALNYSQLGRTLRSARHGYANTVIDAPRVPTSISADLARGSDAVLIVLELNVEGVRVTRLLIQHLLAQDIPAAKLFAVVNRIRRRGQIMPLSQAKGALEPATIQRITNDYRRAVSSLNFGKPLTNTAPRSKLRQDIRRLAESLSHSISASDRNGLET